MESMSVQSLRTHYRPLIMKLNNERSAIGLPEVNMTVEVFFSLEKISASSGNKVYINALFPDIDNPLSEPLGHFMDRYRRDYSSDAFLYERLRHCESMDRVDSSDAEFARQSLACSELYLPQKLSFPIEKMMMYEMEHLTEHSEKHPKSLPASLANEALALFLIRYKESGYDPARLEEIADVTKDDLHRVGIPRLYESGAAGSLSALTDIAATHAFQFFEVLHFRQLFK
jgi:hypothetical protein